MGRTNKRARPRSRAKLHYGARRKRREIRTQLTNPPQRRTPHSVVPVDRADNGDPDNEFDHSDDWLTPYEPTEEAL